MRHLSIEKITKSPTWKKTTQKCCNLTITELSKIIKFTNDNITNGQLRFLANLNELELTNKYTRFRRFYSLDENKRKSHSLYVYIIRYGKAEGLIKYNNKNIKGKMNLDGFISRYGKELGQNKYEKYCKKLSYSASKEGYIDRYGELIGLNKYKEMKDNKDVVSLDSFIKRYGETEGTIRFNNYTKKLSHSLKLEGFISRYGEIEGTIKYKKFIGNLNSYILKYGKVEGTKLYNKKCKKISIAMSIEGFISRYGEIDGPIKYRNYIRKSVYSRSLEGYKNKYGEISGYIKYIKRMKNLMVNYGEASKESLYVFIPIYKILRKLGINREDIKFGVNGSSEYIISEDNKNYLFDFTILPLKLIFEYNGERFHSNPLWKTTDIDRWNNWRLPFNKRIDSTISYEYQLKKINTAINNGFDVIELWSSDSILTNINKCKTCIKKKLNV